MIAAAKTITAVSKVAAQVSGEIQLSNPNVEVAVTTLPSVEVVSGVSDWLIPIVVAVFGAFLALCFNFYLKRIENTVRRKTTMRNVISILNAYLDELKNSLDIMNGIEARLVKRESPYQESFHILSRKAWDSFRMETAFHTELGLVRNQFIPGVEHPVRTLPTHLKNCFEYVTENYKNTVTVLRNIASTMHTIKDWHSGAVGNAWSELIKYQKGYKMTIKLTEFAVEELRKQCKPKWTDKLLGSV